MRCLLSLCRILSARADIPGVEIRPEREEEEEEEEDGPGSAALSRTYLAEARHVVPSLAATVPRFL
eukprot:2352570-Pyramimonas_sp.AAC.1